MPARSGWDGAVVAALVVGCLGMIAVGAYVVGGAVIDAMRTQQTADVVATLPNQEIVMVAVAQERALADVVDRGCMPKNRDCALAGEARSVLLDGVPELDQDGEPVVDGDGNVSYAQQSAVQGTVAALDQRDESFGALDAGMLDPQVVDAIELTLGDRAAVDRLHDTVEDSPGQAPEAYDQYLRDAAGLGESLVEVTDDELRAHLEAQQLLTGLAVVAAQERPAVSLSLGAFDVGHPGYLEPAAAQVTVVDEQVAAAEDALARSGSDQRVPPIDGDLALVRSAVRSGELGTLTDGQAQGFASESATWFNAVRQVQDALRHETIELSQDQADRATNRALLTVAVTGGVLLVGLIAVIVSSVLVFRRRRTPPPPPPLPPPAWQVAPAWQVPGAPEVPASRPTPQ
jgi:hypothetical protein